MSITCEAARVTAVEDADLSFPFPIRPGLQLEPEYARLRAESPITPVRLPEGDNAWLVTRYADVRRILLDGRFSRALACEPGSPRITAVPPPNSMIISMDPPHHTRLRSIVAKEFTVRRVGQLRANAERMLNGLLDNLEQGPRPADFVAEVAQQFPVLVVGELLGVSASERTAFGGWAQTLLGASSADQDRAMAALGKLAGYVCDMVAARRTHPTQDLIGSLVRAHDEHDRLTDDELVTFGITLLAAGFDTTADQIANAVYVLLTHPDQYRLLRGNPRLVTTAVEELMRYIPLATTTALPYVATVDVEFESVTISKGDTVLLSIISANKDSDVFVNADQLDLARDPNPHIGFGHGIHHCLGAQLARMQLQVLLTLLPQRFPDLALATPSDDVTWKHAMLTRGPAQLPVTW